MQDDLTIPPRPPPRGPLGTDIRRLWWKLSVLLSDPAQLTAEDVGDILHRIEDIRDRVDALEDFHGLVRRNAEVVRLRPKLRVVRSERSAGGGTP